MGRVIEVPRFQRDADRAALEEDIFRFTAQLAKISTPDEFTRFWHALAREAMRTGKRLPGNVDLPSDARAE